MILGCGGYVNVLKDGGYVSSPNWNGDLAMSEYPDQCLWFIEARNEGETILLRKDDSTSLSNLSLLLPQIRSPITVSFFKSALPVSFGYIIYCE